MPLKPHVFQPGKDPKLPGPYCKFCHFNISFSNPRGCPARRRRARPVTQAMMWRYAVTNGWVHCPYRYVAGKTATLEQVMTWMIRADGKQVKRPR